MIWLCITSVFSLLSHVCGQNFEATRLKVFPAVDQSIAGVFQVTSLNHLGQPLYAFNASEARQLCLYLGVTIAGKAQVEEALSRGLETCRFGWIDEHLAVIPRARALSTCGQNHTGLVTWRTSVVKKFDVFCFNETAAAAQLEDATTGSPLSSGHYSEQTASTQTASIQASFSSHHPPSSSSSAPKTIDTEWEAALHVGSAHGSARGKAALITCACVLLLIAVVVVVYLKMKKNCAWGVDVQQQQEEGESSETQDWKSGEDLKQNQSDTEGDEKIEMESHVTD